MSKLTAIAIVILLILRELFFSGAYMHIEKSYEKPIFDMHCHTKEGSMDGKVMIEEYIKRDNEAYIKEFGPSDKMNWTVVNTIKRLFTGKIYT